ncbi:MAG TPA: AsmA-like C-terminal region-containing protein [Elusimicrobiota bacterium]|nr:AsmA-like C-terminal region-containing protein [Elusimicrobiota bacterium]
MKPMEWARGALRLLGKTLHGILRGIGWLFLIAVVLCAGLATFVYRRFSPQDAKRLAEEQMTGLLHREVTIDSLVLSPHGLKVLGVRVRRGRAETEGDLLTCDSALMTFKLKPLLQRHLDLESVVLQSPQISVSRSADGVWSIADVFGSTAAARPSLLPVTFAAASTVIEDGVVRVDDRLRARHVLLRNVSLRVDAFNLDKPFPVEVSFASSDTVAGRSIAASVSASGRVDLAGLRWSSATVVADRFRVEGDDLVLTGRASASNFASPVIEAAMDAPPAGPNVWRALFGREANVTIPPSHWSLKAELPAAGMIDVQKLVVDTPAGSASATGLFDLGDGTPNLSVEVSARDADLAKISSWAPALSERGLEGKATLRAAITGWPGRLQARDADLSLRGFGLKWDGRRVDGADIDASATEDFSKVKATATQGRVFAIGNTFEEIAGALTLDKQNVTIERLAFRWGGSRVKLRARLLRRAAPAPNEIELSGSVDKIDWDAGARLWSDIRAAISTKTATASAADEDQPWLRTFKYSIPHGFPDTTGHVHIGEVSHPNFNCKDVEFLWSIRGVTPALDKISGEARLSLGAGRVNDIPALQDSNKFLNVVFLPFIFMHKMNKLSVFSTATAYPKSLDFSRIDGEYGASRGVATTRYFHVESSQLVAYAEGTADFGRELVDMNILTRLGSYDGTLPEWWVDEKGRPAIGFRVKGDMNKPDLEPRFKKIEENEIERDVEAGRARAQKRFENLEKLQTF